MSSTLVILSLITIIHQINAQTVNCNGNCECPSVSLAQTCILNCHGGDECKDSTLKCRRGDECIINCNGDNSCSGNAFIDASGATDVTVSCIGINACKGNTIINCGTQSCGITCGSRSSCLDTTVNADSATSLECTGICDTFASIPTPFVLTTYAPTLIPTYIPSLIPTKSPNLYPTSNPTLYPTLNPTKQPTISWNPSYVPSVAPTKSPTTVPSVSPLATSLEIEDPETFLSTIITEESIIYNYNISTNPMWYIVIGSAVLIVTGSIICCCAIFFYYKHKEADIIQYKDKPNPVLKIASISSVEVIKNDGDILTVPRNVLQPGSSVFEDNNDDAKIDDIGNDLEIINTNDGIDMNESESRDDLSSCSKSSTKESRDGDDVNTVCDAYAEAEAVCSVIDPQMINYGFYNVYPINMIPYQIPYNYQYGYISPPGVVPQPPPHPLSQ